MSTVNSCKKRPKSLIPKYSRAFPQDFFEVEEPMEPRLLMSRQLYAGRNVYSESDFQPGGLGSRNQQQLAFPYNKAIDHSKNDSAGVTSEITFRIQDDVARGYGRANAHRQSLEVQQSICIELDEVESTNSFVLEASNDQDAGLEDQKETITFVEQYENSHRNEIISFRSKPYNLLYKI